MMQEIQINLCRVGRMLGDRTTKYGSPGIPVVKPTSSVLGCPRTME
jgi:hypothetical protein